MGNSDSKTDALIGTLFAMIEDGWDYEKVGMAINILDLGTTEVGDIVLEAAQSTNKSFLYYTLYQELSDQYSKEEILDKIGWASTEEVRANLVRYVVLWNILVDYIAPVMDEIKKRKSVS